MAQGAARGAKAGSMVGGPVGTAVGAAAGGLWSNKVARRWMIAGAVLPPLATVLSIVLVVTLLGSAVSSIFGGRNAAAALAAQTDAVDPGWVEALGTAGGAYGVEWEFLAAIPYGYGERVVLDGDQTEAPDPDAPAGDDEHDAEDGPEEGAEEHAEDGGHDTDDGSVSVFHFKYARATEFAEAHGLRVPTKDELDDPEVAAVFAAQSLASVFARADLGDLSLDSGIRQVYDASDTDALTFEVISQEEDPAAAESAEAARDAYIGAIEGLPLADMDPDRATKIYDTALAWHLGQSTNCTGGAQVAMATGAWTNPAPGVPLNTGNLYGTPNSGYAKGYHAGVDITLPGDADLGLPVYAAAGGTVSQRPGGAYGDYYVEIDHGNGIKTRYAHMRVATVADGQVVSAGTQVGEIGNEGNSHGAHLHFEVLVNGTDIDPVPFLAERGVVLGSGSGDAVDSGSDSGSGSTAVPVSTGGSSTTAGGSFEVTSAEGGKVTISAAAAGYATEIKNVATAMGLPQDAVLVAYMTVLQESKFANLANDGIRGEEDPQANDADLAVAALSMGMPHDGVGTDHDSVGLFQQRRSWGASDDPATNVSNRLNVTHAATKFFEALEGVSGWQDLPKGVAAQSTQRSAYPDAYAQWEQAANDIYIKAGGLAVSGAACANGSGQGATFNTGTLNAFGCSHDGERAGWPNCRERLDTAMSIVQAAEISVLGLQEFQKSWDSAKKQHEAFIEKYGTEWELHAAGHPFHDAVAWRKDTWSLVEADSFNIPYYQSVADVTGGGKEQPLVKLRNGATGQMVWFASVHNPASGDTLNIEHGYASAEEARIEAEKRAAAKFAEVRAADPTTPIIYVGDMNETEQFKNRFLAASAPADEWHVAGEKPGVIDWMLGTGDVTFSGYKVDRSVIDQKAADHPLVHATATVGGGGIAGGDVAAVIDFARAQIGKGYSQDSGLRLGPTHFDCSGLVYRAYQKVGVTLGLTTATQQHDGEAVTPVNAANLQPGDLIFYYSPISHVALYIGNGRIIHAANPSTGVVEADWDSMPVTSARRITVPTVEGA